MTFLKEPEISDSSENIALFTKTKVSECVVPDVFT